MTSHYGVTGSQAVDENCTSEVFVQRLLFSRVLAEQPYSLLSRTALSYMVYTDRLGNVPECCRFLP